MIIELRGRVAAGRWEDLVSFLREAIPFYQQPGGIGVRLLRDLDDPDVFIEVVDYDTDEAYATDQHRVRNDPEMIARLAQWRGLLAGPVEVRTFRDVTPVPDWPAAELIQTARLSLEPLRVGHAAEMAPLLDDADLHRYVGGRPATPAELRERYRRQAAGRSPDGRQGWLNWVVRQRQSGAAVGFVQATLSRDAGQPAAALAWVIGIAHQRHGYASEATAAMLGWLRRQDIHHFSADIHPEHHASSRIAERLGLTRTQTVTDGETHWITPPP